MEHRLEADSPEFVTARQASWIVTENFVRRKWLRRLWAIREIHLVRESVMVVGDDELHWRIFNVAFMWIRTNVPYPLKYSFG